MSPAFAAMLEALRTTSGNIRSLAPAGHIEPFTPYRPWLQVVEDAIKLAEVPALPLTDEKQAPVCLTDGRV